MESKMLIFLNQKKAAEQIAWYLSQQLLLDGTKYLFGEW